MVSKSVKKVKSVKAVKAVKKVVTPETPVVVAEAVTPEVPVTSEQDAVVVIKGLCDRIKEITKEFTTKFNELSTELRLVSKQVEAERRKSKKRIKKPVDPNKPAKKPSGITQDKPVSDELCTFLGLSNGSELSMVKASNKIREYVKSNGLTNQENKKLWIPDDKLKSLFKLTETDEIGHFSIMKHLKGHFPKSAAALAAEAATAAA